MKRRGSGRRFRGAGHASPLTRIKGIAVGAILARDVAHREEESEGAALILGALDPDFATEQSRNLAADGKSETRTAVLAAGRAIGLLERLEDQTLLVLRDSNSGVGHREGENF